MLHTYSIPTHPILLKLAPKNDNGGPTITMSQTPCPNQGEADITLMQQKPIKHHLARTIKPRQDMSTIHLGNVHTQSMDVMFSDLHDSTFRNVQ